MASIEETIRKHVDAFNAHDASAWASHYAEDAVVEDPAYADMLEGRAATEHDIADFFRAFPDAHMELRHVMAKNNTYAFECTVSGTHRGPLELPSGKVEPTNRHFELHASVFGGVDAHGEIVDEHRYFDLARRMRQLGLVQ